MGSDPNSIDLDRPEASGIGSPPRRADFGARASLVTAYRDAIARDLPRDSWSALIRAGELISTRSTKSAALDAAAILRFVQAVVAEDAAEEAAGAAGSANVGSSGAETANCQVAPVAPPPAYRCSKCGGTNVEHAAWTTLNEPREILGDFGSWCAGDNSWCNDCEDHTDLEETE